MGRRRPSGRGGYGFRSFAPPGVAESGVAESGRTGRARAWAPPAFRDMSSARAPAEFAGGGLAPRTPPAGGLMADRRTGGAAAEGAP